MESTFFAVALWAGLPSPHGHRTNGAKACHSKLNAQFISPHWSFFVFWDVIIKQRTVTYINMNSIDIPAPVTATERNKTYHLQYYAIAKISSR